MDEEPKANANAANAGNPSVPARYMFRRRLILFVPYGDLYPDVVLCDDFYSFVRENERETALMLMLFTKQFMRITEVRD